MSARWRLIDSGPVAPDAAMALDEALLQSYASRSSLPTFRIYGWDRPAFSVGFSQDPGGLLDLGRCRAASIPVVRRITGGGIILHGNELTYSIVCAKEDLGIPSRVISSYRSVASFLILFYRKLGLDARFACEAGLYEDGVLPGALCFASKEKYDIVAGGRKIGGSAQKRTRNLIFQHGSIPFAVDMRCAAAFLRDEGEKGRIFGAAGLEELLGRTVKRDVCAAALVEAFREAFGADVERGALSPDECAAAAELAETKYNNDEWNYGRQDPQALVAR